MFNPNFVHEKAINPDGTWTDPWKQFFTQLIDQLNQNFSEEGLVAPTQTSALDPSYPDGSKIAAIAVTAANGTMLYDSNTNTVKVRLNDGTFHSLLT